jgi:hypothetical protein
MMARCLQPYESQLTEGDLHWPNKIMFNNHYIMHRSITPLVIRSLTPRASYRFSQSIETVLKNYSQELADSQLMEAMIPRQFTEQNLVAISSNQRFSQGTNHISSLTKTFSQPIWDLLDRGGKRWRPVLCMLIAELLGRKRS